MFNVYSRTTPDFRTRQPPLLELLDHSLHGNPLDPFMLIDPLNQALMHQNDLRLPADLGMDAHGEHKRVVFTVQESELVLPQPLDHVGVDVAVGGGLFERQLERRPVVQMPVGGHLDDLGWLEGRQGFHPLLGGLGHVGLDPFLAAVGHVVQLRVVVHERVVVFDAKFLEEPDRLARRRPCWGGPAFGLFAREIGEDLDRFGQHVSLLLFAEG